MALHLELEELNIFKWLAKLASRKGKHWEREMKTDNVTEARWYRTWRAMVRCLGTKMTNSEVSGWEEKSFGDYLNQNLCSLKTRIQSSSDFVSWLPPSWNPNWEWRYLLWLLLLGMFKFQVFICPSTAENSDEILSTFLFSFIIFWLYSSLRSYQMAQGENCPLLTGLLDIQVLAAMVAPNSNFCLSWASWHC